MIHLVTAANRHLYRDQLQAFHRARRDHFIVERGWALQERDGGEYDRYDDDLAACLMGLDRSGALAAACRIRPTLESGLIPDVFPHLLAPHEPDPRAPGVYECTRYFVTAAVRGRAGFALRSELHAAMIEHVRDLGGHRLLGFVDLPLLTHLRRFSGLRIRPVGLPCAYDEDGVTIAFEIGVSEEDLAATRARLRLTGRRLFVAPAWLPAGTDVLALERTVDVLTGGDGGLLGRFADEVRRLSADLVRPDPDAVMQDLARAA